jgi:hypothetical protein
MAGLKNFKVLCHSASAILSFALFSFPASLVSRDQKRKFMSKMLYSPQMAMN